MTAFAVLVSCLLVGAGCNRYEPLMLEDSIAEKQCRVRVRINDGRGNTHSFTREEAAALPTPPRLAR
jgi:hypothetical protein